MVEILDNERTGAYDPSSHKRFARAQTALRRRFSEQDVSNARAYRAPVR